MVPCRCRNKVVERVQRHNSESAFNELHNALAFFSSGNITFVVTPLSCVSGGHGYANVTLTPWCGR